MLRGHVMPFQNVLKWEKTNNTKYGQGCEASGTICIDCFRVENEYSHNIKLLDNI